MKANRIASHLILIFGACIVAFPFFWMVSTSLKTDAEAGASRQALLPADFHALT